MGDASRKKQKGPGLDEQDCQKNGVGCSPGLKAFDQQNDKEHQGNKHNRPDKHAENVHVILPGVESRDGVGKTVETHEYAGNEPTHATA